MANSRKIMKRTGDTTSNVDVHIEMRSESIDKERHEDVTGITSLLT